MKRSLSAPSRGALLNEWLTPLQFSLSLPQLPALAGAPRGNGDPVLVWPGFGAGNASTAVLRRFLRYLGHDAQGWPLGQNDGDVLAMLEFLGKALHKAAANGPVNLVGWSLGGYLAREVARDYPHLVKRVVTLGSPVVGGPKYTAVANFFNNQQGALDEIERAVDERYAKPLQVPVTAIYSKADGVVAWRACIDQQSPDVEHVEVISSHVGLGFAPQALRIVADRLARPAPEAAP